MSEEIILEEENKPNETKREKFIRLAEYRTNKILDMIRVLGNCSNRATNEYTESDVEQIFGAIETALRDTKARFLTPAVKKAVPFQLNPQFPNKPDET